MRVRLLWLSLLLGFFLFGLLFWFTFLRTRRVRSMGIQTTAGVPHCLLSEYKDVWCSTPSPAYIVQLLGMHTTTSYARIAVKALLRCTRLCFYNEPLRKPQTQSSSGSKVMWFQSILQHHPHPRCALVAAVSSALAYTHLLALPAFNSCIL